MEGLKVEGIHAKGFHAAPFYIGACDHGLVVDPYPERSVALGRCVLRDDKTRVDRCASGEAEFGGKGETIPLFTLLILVIDVGLATSVGAPHESCGEAVDAVRGAASAAFFRAAAEPGQLPAFNEV